MENLVELMFFVCLCFVHQNVVWESFQIILAVINAETPILPGFWYGNYLFFSCYIGQEEFISFGNVGHIIYDINFYSNEIPLKWNERGNFDYNRNNFGDLRLFKGCGNWFPFRSLSWLEVWSELVVTSFKPTGLSWNVP